MSRLFDTADSLYGYVGTISVELTSAASVSGFSLGCKVFYPILENSSVGVFHSFLKLIKNLTRLNKWPWFFITSIFCFTHKSNAYSFVIRKTKAVELKKATHPVARGKNMAVHIRWTHSNNDWWHSKVAQLSWAYSLRYWWVLTCSVHAKIWLKSALENY